MARTKDFERYIEACNYPGVLDVAGVESNLRAYLKALKVKRHVVRLEAGWKLDDHPSLKRYTDRVLDDLIKHNPQFFKPPVPAIAARVASAARDTHAALAARAALDASVARDALAASEGQQRFAAWCVQDWNLWWVGEVSWLAATHLGAQETMARSVLHWTEPLFEAFIVGAWLLHWTDDTLYWVAKPRVHTELVDRRRQLHNSEYAAVESDVENLYFWHGVLVPAFVVVNPELITADHVLKEENAEVRRVMIERMGIERFLAEADAKVLGSDVDLAGQNRRLLAIELPSDPDGRLVAVEVNCPSTAHQYILRVPPTMKTCQQAVAWTFGIEPKEYAPAVEA